jgi:hypothetical protein
MSRCLPISARENTDVEPELKSDTYGECDRTHDTEPEPVGDDRTDQNCNANQMTFHTNTSVGPNESR